MYCDVFRDMVGSGRPDVRHFFQKIRSTNFCVLLFLLCFKKSALRVFACFCLFCVSKSPLYGLLSSFVSFVFQKAPSTNFCVLLSLLCFKKPLYELLCTFVSFVFQKAPSTDFCVLLSLLCFKKPLYGLLCSFVTFVFQKTALRAFMMCSTIWSGVDGPTYSA